GVGWMQSTGQTSTHELSFCPMHGSAMTYAMSLVRISSFRVRERSILWKPAAVLLLTGATGLVGSALLRRLTATGQPVRCLVRDPRRLGPDRVRVQIALGDLADPPSFRNALRGVATVVHLAAAIRDQRSGSIEELNG